MDLTHRRVLAQIRYAFSPKRLHKEGFYKACRGEGSVRPSQQRKALWSWMVWLRCWNSVQGTQCVRKPRILKREQEVAEEKKKETSGMPKINLTYFKLLFPQGL